MRLNVVRKKNTSFESLAMVVALRIYCSNEG